LGLESTDSTERKTYPANRPDVMGKSGVTAKERV